jgi:hypothetical protein
LAVTRACGTTAPVPSVTVPARRALSVCAIELTTIANDIQTSANAFLKLLCMGEVPQWFELFDF